jgi:uncharacterized membrane protein
VIAVTGSALVLIRRSRSASANRDSNSTDQEMVRLELGRWLALALEFDLAADILRTAVAPTWNDIGQLAAIVLLRTALSFFLRLKIEKARESSTPPPR